MKAGRNSRKLWATLALGTMVALALMMANGCGDKLSLPSDLPKPDPSSGGIDTAYVLVNPIWTGANGIQFNKPHDIAVGYDQYLYVCDTKNNRIVKLAEDGTFIESDSIVNPVAITQDRGLDLLVVSGDYYTTQPDTIFAGTDSMEISLDTTAYGNAINRKKYFGDEGFKVVWEADSPYHSQYYPQLGRDLWFEAQFWGISASLETSKEYFLADFWKGRILKFNSQDKPVPPELVSEGTGVGQTQYPMDLFYYSIAGQNYLALAQGTGNLGVQIVSPVNGTPLFVSSEEGLPPLIRFSVIGAKQVAVDEQSNFYVLVERNSSPPGHLFFKYNRRGEYLLSFGSEGSGERQFGGARGLAYMNGIIYIADTGNNRIVRYQLATDVQQ